MTLIVSGYGQKADLVDGAEYNFVEIFDLEGERLFTMTTDTDQFRELLAFIHANGAGPTEDEVPHPEGDDPEDGIDIQEPDEF